jgi:lipopolysaccharide/colanic/teichoic acid biosynthesis glycosyltransferase
MQKRMFDVLCSIALLAIFFIPMFVIAILVKMSSPGPIIFKQKRIGHHGAVFTMYKFRTMFVDAEKCLSIVTTRDDTRITSVGKFLRSTHLDELPQVWNVLIGEMSVVGPRPATLSVAQISLMHEPRYNERFAVLPGLTGLVQAQGREWGLRKGTRSIHLLNRHYIRHQSFCLDCRIVLQTILVMVRRLGM